jgi:hypothetical protein
LLHIAGDVRKREDDLIEDRKAWLELERIVKDLETSVLEEYDQRRKPGQENMILGTFFALGKFQAAITIWRRNRGQTR